MCILKPRWRFLFVEDWDDPVELCRRLITDAATFRALESWGGQLLVIEHKEGQSVTDICERMGV